MDYRIYIAIVVLVALVTASLGWNLILSLELKKFWETATGEHRYVRQTLNKKADK